MADLRLFLPCRHEVIRDVDTEQEVIYERTNTVLLPIFVKIDGASSVK